VRYSFTYWNKTRSAPTWAAWAALARYRLSPASDVPLLAKKIRRTLLDDDLADRPGRVAHKVARERHDPKTVVEQLIASYEQILTSGR
jgi:hypothetical protein